MPRKKPKTDATYFNEANKHRVVEDFVVSYLNQTMTVIITKFLEDMEPPKNLYSQEIHYRSLAEGQVFDRWKIDERFSNLKQTVIKYTKSDIDKIQRKSLEDVLYSLIIDAMAEHRIMGDFRLQPYRDWEINNLTTRIGDLERRARSPAGGIDR